MKRDELIDGIRDQLRKADDRTPPISRGETIEVRERGIRPWTGTVRSVKWSRFSGWWADVDAGFGRTLVIALEGDTDWSRVAS